MNGNRETPPNLMDISIQQIKEEPPDEVKVEEMVIGDFFENDLSGLHKCFNEPSVHTKIVREDADLDEIVKEEPRFDDEFVVYGFESTSTSIVSANGSDEVSLKRTTCSSDGNFQEKFVTVEQTAHQTKKTDDLAASKRSSRKSQTRVSKKRHTQKKPMKTAGVKGKVHKNYHHQTKAAAASSTSIRARRQVSLKDESPKGSPAVKVNHLENPTFECFMCKATVSSANNLKRHYDRFHGEKLCEKLFHCNLCSKRYSIKSSLDKHLHTHSDVNTSKCKICLRKFANQANLRRHNESCRPMNVTAAQTKAQPGKGQFVAKVNRGRVYQCHLCKIMGGDLKTIQDIQVHVITKHTDGNILLCNICRQIFSTQSELIQHMHIHTKNKPYECDVCNMQFRTTRNIKRHKRLHTRIGLYKCDKCSKEYTTKYSRDAHQKKHNGMK